MNDHSDQNAETTEPALPSELDQLKSRANTLGITYHPSIGIDKLREKVNAEITLPVDPKEAALTEVLIGETVIQRNNRLRKEAGRLVRVRVTCMNPNKKEWTGEIFTVANSVVGTFKKMVPFNVEDGWHVPQIILNVLKDKQCQIFHTVVNSKGQKVRVGKLIKEFGIEIMDPLTETAYNELKTQQAMANNLG